jgi:WD40 repeat protein
MYLSFSRDGRSLAIGYAAVGHSRHQAYKAVIMEVSTGRPRCTIGGKGPCVVALSPNGRLLAARRDRGLQVWDVASGKEVEVANEPVGGFCFSPDSGLLAIGPRGGGIALWDVVANRRLAFVEGKNWQTEMMFSGTGDTLASRDGPKSIRTWDVTRRREQLNVELDNTVRIFRIALSYDGTTVAVARESFRAEGFVELLDATTGKELLRLKHHTQVVSVAFSPDGKLLALGDIDNTVQVWKLPQLRR